MQVNSCFNLENNERAEKEFRNEDEDLENHESRVNIFEEVNQ